MAAVVFSERGRPRRAVTSSANPVLPFAMAQFSSPVVSPQPDRGLDLAQIGTWPKMTWSENGIDLLAVSASLKLLLVVGRAFARPGDLANLLPVGQITPFPDFSVQPSCEKYSASLTTQINLINSAVSSPTRGAYRDRHGRWDGMRWTRQRRARNRNRRAILS